MGEKTKTKRKHVSNYEGDKYEDAESAGGVKVISNSTVLNY